jgi:Mg-chelatase subunit ChlI
VLLQGAPGLGKTLLSKSLAGALGGVFKRVQGTADLMPSDITGVHVFDTERRDFVFRPGPVFADVLLVDEINRTGPKTQSALLEAMEERQVTIDRKNYRLPDKFLVIATQNPREFEGTYPLPESQLDRFMLRIDLAYPAREHELEILAKYGNADAHAGSCECRVGCCAGRSRERARGAGAQRLRRRYRCSIAPACACESRIVDARCACAVACCADRRWHAWRGVRDAR